MSCLNAAGVAQASPRLIGSKALPDRDKKQTMRWLNCMTSQSSALRRGLAGVLASLFVLALQSSSALAQAAADSPERWRWQVDLLPAATPLQARLIAFHDMLLVVSVAICVLVFALLAYIVYRFRASKNPVPSKVSHNTVLEIMWTVVPVIILILIAIPSFQLLYYLDRTDQAEVTFKAIGHQWYWEYQYPDHNITFNSNMIPDNELKPGQPRLLEVDNRLVLPVNTNVRVLTTATDVLHAWTIPSFGVKKDANPGHTNEMWFRAEREGVFYGQCSEICGINHAFMPIAVEIVSKERFAAWLQEAQQKFSSVPAERDNIQLARSGND